MKRKSFIVTVDWNECVPLEELQAFIWEAVDMWGGQHEPPSFDSVGDPLFGTKNATVVPMKSGGEDAT